MFKKTANEIAVILVLFSCVSLFANKLFYFFRNHAKSPKFAKVR